MTINTTAAAEINRLHALARTKASETINHAMDAGKLLLACKATTEHGKWGKWLSGNLSLSARQVQRYIALAQGKPLPIRAIAGNNDTVSHLTDRRDVFRELGPL